jgi:outer membrane protein
MNTVAHRRLALALVAVAVVAGPGDARAQALTPAEVVARALERSPGLRAALLDLRAADSSVDAARALHRPGFTAEATGGHSESLRTMSQPSMSGASSNSVGLDLGLNYTAPFGTQVGVGATGAWTPSADGTDLRTGEPTTFGPYYSVEARLEATQPLLRGAGRDVGEAELRSAQLARTAAEHARDDAASTLLRDVLTAYWELWYAQATVEVETAARELARQQVAEAEARASTLGTLARADVLRFSSELASIEEALAQAESDRRSRALALGELLDATPAEAAGFTATTTGEPPELVVQHDVASAVALAAEASSALRQARAEVDSSLEQIRVAQDAVLPQLDLTASLGVGEMWQGDALATTGDRPALSATGGLALELPLGNGRARAQLGEARARAEAAQARLDAQTRAVEIEAARLMDQHATAQQRVELARRTVDLARQLAEAERGRLELGTSTSLLVLEAQESQRDTELRFLRALVDQAAAALAVEHLTGELLARYAPATGAR